MGLGSGFFLQPVLAVPTKPHHKSVRTRNYFNHGNVDLEPGRQRRPWLPGNSKMMLLLVCYSLRSFGHRFSMAKVSRSRLGFLCRVTAGGKRGYRSFIVCTTNVSRRISRGWPDLLVKPLVRLATKPLVRLATGLLCTTLLIRQEQNHANLCQMVGGWLDLRPETSLQSGSAVGIPPKKWNSLKKNWK